MKKTSKLLSLLLVLSMLLAFAAGCGSNDTPAANDDDTGANTDAPVADAPDEGNDIPEDPDSGAEASDSYFPLEEEQTISYWYAMNMEESSLVTNMTETPGYQYLMELLNVDLEMVCASAAASMEQFNMMIASGDYCDILTGIATTFMGGYPGGPSKACEDGVIIDMTEYINQYCPNYLGMLEESGQMKNAKTDDGQFLVFYPINTEYKALTGVTVRNDLLKALDMDVPVTYDDYAEFGRAVKSEFGLSDPIYLSADTNTWVYGYNVTGFAASAENGGTDHIFQKDGVVTSSFREDDYREYLKLMNSWYNEGLVNYDFYSRETNIKSSMMESIIFSGEIGIYCNDANSMAHHEDMSAVEGTDLVGAPWPRLTEDSVVHVSTSLDKLQTMGTACISTDCENHELVFRFMDWFYTDQAMKIASFGIPDLYVENDDGTVTYTNEARDMFENNEWGTSAQNAQGMYRAGIAGKKTQMDMFVSWGMDSKQVDAVNLWNSNNYDDTWLIPSTASLTTEGSEVVAQKASEIATYAAQSVIRFVTGELSIDNDWDAFIQQIEDMGLQDVIDAYQEAVDNYNKR